MKKMIILGICVISMIGMIGCSKVSKETKDTDTSVLPTVNEVNDTNDTDIVETETPVVQAKVKAPDISGEVLEVKEEGKLILIESKDTTITGQVWVTITDETNFFEDLDDAALAYHDVSRVFEVGNHVEIISDGVVLESYPSQTSASAVAVNEKK